MVSISPESIFVDIGRKVDGVLPVELFRDAGRRTDHSGGRQDAGEHHGAGCGRVLHAFHHQSGAPQGLERIGASVRREARYWRRGHRAGKGRIARGCRLPAFLPASRSGAKDQAELEKLVGQEIQCRIIKLDTASEDVVVDRRAILEEEEARTREQKFGELKEGAVVRGTIRSLTDFGAFVDLGGVDGLLHVGDMAWHRVAKPSDVVTAGDSIEVKILKINPEGKRISLGLKQLAADPWTTAAERFHTGDRVQGKVSRLGRFRRVRGVAAGRGRADPHFRNVVGQEGQEAQRSA